MRLSFSSFKLVTHPQKPPSAGMLTSAPHPLPETEQRSHQGKREYVI